MQVHRWKQLKKIGDAMNMLCVAFGIHCKILWRIILTTSVKSWQQYHSQNWSSTIPWDPLLCQIYMLL